MQHVKVQSIEEFRRAKQILLSKGHFWAGGNPLSDLYVRGTSFPKKILIGFREENPMKLLQTSLMDKDYGEEITLEVEIDDDGNII